MIVTKGTPQQHAQFEVLKAAIELVNNVQFIATSNYALVKKEDYYNLLNSLTSVVEALKERKEVRG